MRPASCHTLSLDSPKRVRCNLAVRAIVLNKLPKQSTIGEDGSLADAAKRGRRQATSSNHCAGTRIALMVERLAYDCAAQEHVAVVNNRTAEHNTKMMVASAKNLALGSSETMTMVGIPTDETSSMHMMALPM